jgi:hypothetical protein
LSDNRVHLIIANPVARSFSYVKRLNLKAES